MERSSGLGIDTPQGNKLYKDMQDFGIWNFSWELLEECSKEQLNEKEKYYIELYQSKEYGYNTLKRKQLKWEKIIIRKELQKIQLL